MKRAIVLLSSAAFLGVGCGHHCDFRDVALYWHFPNPNGSGEVTCDQVGVAEIQITIDGTVADVVQCLDASGSPAIGDPLIDFLDTAYQFQIDALDANGTVLYSDAFSYTPVACGTNRYDSTLASQAGDMTIGYSFTDTATCTTPRSGASPFPTTYIWFEVTGPDGSQVYSAADRTSNATAIPCGAGGATIVLPSAPFGTYTLTAIEEVEILANNVPIVYHYNCVPTSLPHFAPNDAFDVAMVPQQTGGTLNCGL